MYKPSSQIVRLRVVRDLFWVMKGWRFRQGNSTPNAICLFSYFLVSDIRTQVENRYLCGFTLFLSLILNRTYVLILDILKLEQTVKDLRAESNERVRSGVDNETAKKLEEMTKTLEAKDRELESLRKEFGAIKKQAEGLSREYNALADRHAALTGSDNTPKKDL